MQIDWLVLAVAVLLPSAVTWGVVRWWHRRQHAALSLRLQQKEKAHHALSQQVMQARKQIEKLQLELSQSRRAASQAAAHREKVQKLEAALCAAPAEQAPQPSNGFADTLPM